MKNYGLTISSMRPDEIDRDDYSVWVASDIEEITTTIDGNEVTQYQYNLTQYLKDEYETLQINKLRADIDYIAMMRGVEL